VSVSYPSNWRRATTTAPRTTTILVTPPIVEPLTLEQGKLRAGLDWAPGDARDALMIGWIAAARQQVEADTNIALLTQTWDVFLDARPTSFELPRRPVQSVVVTFYDAAGVAHTLDASNYLLGPSSVAPVPARLGLSPTGTWPTDLRTFQPWAVRIVVGFTTVALLQAHAPELIEAVALLVTHAATGGRDRFTDPNRRDEYEEKIAPYRPVVVA
jgi:uncharacterized phiE125 gp8 family phage protein